MGNFRRPRSFSIPWGCVEGMSLLVSEIAISSVGTISLSGEMDLATVERLDDALGPAVTEGGSVTLDVSEVTFMDSSALHSILKASQSLGDRGCVVVHGVNPERHDAKALRHHTDRRGAEHPRDSLRRASKAPRARAASLRSQPSIYMKGRGRILARPNPKAVRGSSSPMAPTPGLHPERHDVPILTRGGRHGSATTVRNPCRRA